MPMNHQRRITLALIATLLVAFTVGFLTEGLRASMLFQWVLQPGDSLSFEVTVTGYASVGSTPQPPPFAVMNGSVIRAIIENLPNFTIFMRIDDFPGEVVGFMKTSSTFANGSQIPVSQYFQINDLVSRSILPVGNWRTLDMYFPDSVRLAVNSTSAESFIAADRGNMFLIGYTRLTTAQASGWFSYVNKTTGAPLSMSLWAWSSVQPYTYSYNVTLTSIL
jgi:hypothetical protein